MNKKGKGKIVIFGFSLTVILTFIVQFIFLNVATEAAITTLEDLGTNNLCPKEFETQGYSVCFDKSGNVIMNGNLDEDIQLKIDILNDACHITAGSYDFEYTGCKLDNFKQLTAYDLILVNKNGEIRLKGAQVISKIAKGSEIFAITPNGLRWLRRISYIIKFA